MKQCSVCGEWKPVEEFYLIRKSDIARRKQCIPCYLNRQVEARIFRAHNLKDGTYRKLRKRQKDRCAICRRKERLKRRLSLDHCHQTGRVRGLLCHQCNTGIAKFEDDAQRLEAAAAYLRRTS